MVGNSSAMLLCLFLKSLTVSARVTTTEGMALLGSLGATPFCNSNFLTHKDRPIPLKLSLAFGRWDTVHRGDQLLYHSIQCCGSNLLIILTDLVRTTEQILGAYSWFIFGSQCNFVLLFNKYLLAWYTPINDHIWSLFSLPRVIDARKKVQCCYCL